MLSNPRGKAGRARAALALALLLAAPPLAAGAGDGNTAAIIVDATVQMKANLGRQRKLDLVKKAVPAAVARMGAGARAALWAFGIKPKQKCEDTSELVPLQAAPAAASAMATALGAIAPKAGRAPAFGAVRNALASFGDGQPGVLVLIAGAGDDCGGDICASARELAKLHPGVRLFVAGLGMAPPAATAFTCAAKAMGGSFTAVKSGAELDRVLGQALATQPHSAQGKAPTAAQATPTETPPVTVPPPAPATTAGPGPAIPPVPPATGAPAPVPPQPQSAPASAAAPARQTPAPAPEPNVILSAALTGVAPPLDSGVTWRVSKTPASGAGQQKPSSMPVWSGAGGPAKLKLAEGDYEAEIHYGFASARAGFTLGAAKLEKTIPLDAGIVAAEAYETPNGARANGALFMLSRGKPGAAPEEVGRSSAEPATFTVNAGDYTLAASDGLAKVETPVTVQAGKVSAVRMALNLGTLELTTVAAAGRPDPVPVWHRLYAVNSAAPDRAPALLTLQGPSQRLQLPAGSYRVETAYGEVRVENTVAVTPGELTAKTIILDAGVAEIHAAPGPSKRESVCAIYEAGAGHKGEPVGRAAGADVRFIVKAGLYDVECREKGAPAATPAKETQIQVVAGENEAATLPN